MSISYASEQLEKKFPNGGGLAFARRAEALYREQWTDEAVQLLNEGTRNHPGYITGFLLLGRILRETGKLVDATTALENALRLDPRCHSALQMLADIATGLQAHGESARHLAILAALEPWDADFRSAYQNALGKSGGSGSSSAFGSSQESQSSDFSLNEVADFLPKDEGSGLVEAPTASAFAPKSEFGSMPPDTGREDRAAFAAGETAPVSGLDLENRLDTLFGIESAKPFGKTPADEATVLADSAPIPDATTIYQPPTPGAAEVSGAPAGESDRVEGSDIEKRLDDLFAWEGETKIEEKTGTETDTVEAAAILAATETSSAPITGEDVENQLDELFATSGESPSATQFAPRGEPPQPDFAGLDDRTLAMPAFPAAKAKETAPPLPEIPAPPRASSESVVETDDLKPFRETGAFEAPVSTGPDPVVGDDISQRLDQLFGAEASETSVAVQSEDDPGTSETSAFTAPTLDASDSGISGSDVEGRLSEIFGADEGVKTEVRAKEEDAGSQTMQLTRAQLFGDEEKPAAPEKTSEAPLLAMEEESGEEEQSAEPPNVATVTLAEIYFQQGLKEQALQIYRQLLEREPDNETVRKRVEEIEALKSEDDAKGGSDRRAPRPGLKVPRRKK